MKKRGPQSFRRACCFVAMLAEGHAAPALCQVFEVAGGASSLFQSQGGTVSRHSPNLDASFGAGLSGREFVAGGRVIKLTPTNTYTVGSQIISFNLPTDIFDATHYLEALGVAVHRNVRGSDITAFAGALAEEDDGPFFTGSRAQRTAALLLMTRRLSEHVFSVSDVLCSKEMTAIESVGWSISKGTTTAFSVGVGSNKPYAALSFRTTRNWFDIRAAYIEASSHFARSTLGTPLTSEPIHENILIAVKPKDWLTVSGGRERFLTPVSNTASNVSSTVNSFGVSTQAWSVLLTATAFRSVYASHAYVAEAYSASRSLTNRLRLQSSLLTSKSEQQRKTSSLVTNVEEVVSPRFTVSEEITTSAGRTSVGFGGSFLSNLASVSATYQSYFVPANPATPFNTTLILDVQLHALGRVNLHGASFLSPDGHTLYTVDVHKVMSHDSTPDGSHGLDLARNTIGSNLVCSKVVDRSGTPIEGAALLLDKAELYSDSQGMCCLRESRTRSHILTVLGHSFLSGAIYTVISAPHEVQSEPETKAKLDPALVIVQESDGAVR